LVTVFCLCFYLIIVDNFYYNIQRNKIRFGEFSFQRLVSLKFKGFHITSATNVKAVLTVVFLALCSIPIFMDAFGDYIRHPLVSRAENKPTFSVETYMERWLLDRADLITNSNKKLPVFIVSGQGGGSRAGYWMAKTMMKLDSVSPGFHRQCLAFSTVSGSSFGVTSTLAIWNEKKQRHEQNSTNYNSCLRNIF
jgi:hypothetical protein